MFTPFLHCAFSLSTGLHVPHSFPTRRSSDLLDAAVAHVGPVGSVSHHAARHHVLEPTEGFLRSRRVGQRARRSEEHTSELQSRRDLVCRLLREKKKNQEMSA